MTLNFKEHHLALENKLCLVEGQPWDTCPADPRGFLSCHTQSFAATLKGMKRFTFQLEPLFPSRF